MSLALFDPERIHAALFARLSDRLGKQIRKATRIDADLTKFSISDHPVMFVYGADGEAIYNGSLPPEWILRSGVTFFVQTAPNDKSAPETALHALLKQTQIALAVQRTAGEVNADYDGTTLGGLVQYCRITRYALHEGAGESQIAITIHIEMQAIPIP